MEQKDPLGFLNAVKDFKTQQGEFAKTLQGLPVLQPEFSKEELDKILALRKFLDDIQTIVNFPTNTTEKIFKTLSQAQSYLDKLEIWDSKFTTGELGKLRSTDSVYYKTPQGIALRFKMANVGIKNTSIIQPFMDNIVFDKDRGNSLELMPGIGLYPQEYLSKEFYNLQKGTVVNEGFVSSVKLFIKEGKVYYVQGPEHLKHEHFGSAVNQIVFIR